MFVLINILVFQVGWLAAVIGGAHQMPWLGPVALVVMLLIHLNAARHPIEELVLVLFCGVLGAAFDSILVANGWVSYSSGLISASLAPYWIVAMWMMFAMTLNVSMKWFRGKPLTSAVFGFFGGPLSYIAGEELGAITLLNPLASLTMLGLGWAVMMPLLMSLSEKLDGMPSEPRLRNRWTAEVQEC